MALIALVAPVGGVLAKEAPVATAELTDGGGEIAAIVDLPIEGTAGRVFLAAAVGQVTVDKAADVIGRKVYADRSQIAGSASVVSFSTRPRRTHSNRSLRLFGAPLTQAVVTSRFGALRAEGGGGTRAHAGVDLAAPQGSRVTAAIDGKISFANWAGSYGLLVVVDHADGMQTRYAHLSSIGVSPGQTVRRGEVIGLVGSTGRSTGPHLHYELRQDGRPLDPLVAAR
jgi:murein DD-endopeptidase MepM/ murein hydrolase activator NlpD